MIHPKMKAVAFAGGAALAVASALVASGLLPLGAVGTVAATALLTFVAGYMKSGPDS